MRVKILQWNIWYLEDINKIIDVIRYLDPDICCLQELSGNTQVNPGIETDSIIKERFSYFSHVAKAQEWVGWHKDYQANGIFSKFPILGGNTIFLRHPHVKETIDWSREGRVYIDVDISIDGRILTVGTTHLSYTHKFMGGDERIEEEICLKSILRDKTNSYFFSGDLNSPENSEIVAHLRQQFRDCGPADNIKTWTTKPFDYQGFKEDALNWRLDYAFVTNDINVLSSNVVQTDASDHLPIIIEIEVNA
ncbi:hypothetical protein A3197_17525 [Candidatus Thiodiazotropha endoloripes]|nr:hypothetical protein A3197_17525 [Candidatus Thiodiazotropha endoloripes]